MYVCIVGEFHCGTRQFQCSGWGWSVQLQFLVQRMYLGVLFTLAFRNACSRQLFVIVFFGDSLFVYNLFAFAIYSPLVASIVFLLLHFTATARLMLRCGSPLSPGHDVGHGVSEQSASTF